MAGITTHILDTSKGSPASGVPVSLEVERAGGWETVGRGITDADGRLRTLTEGKALEKATYRLRFETGGFFPEVTITFRVDTPGEHYHVPLLLSPYGYTTYRGS
jgi:5-hydroxyisourate hydrolase